MRKWIVIAALALSVMFCTIGAPGGDKIPMDSQMQTAMVAASTAVNVPTQMPVMSGPGSETATPGPGTPTAVVLQPGTVTGKLTYPADVLPALRVVAFDVKTGNVTKFVNTEAGQTSYTLELPPATYHIVAYVIPHKGFPEVAGGYTRAVPCGLAIECADHGYIEVTVLAGKTISGIDPGDFFADDGTFPPRPGD